MDKEEPSSKKLGVLLIIFVTLVSFAAIMPFYSKSEIQTDKPCLYPEGGSWLQQQTQEDNTKDQLNCLPDYEKELLKLYILGIINIDELSMWVLGVDRRLIEIVGKPSF